MAGGRGDRGLASVARLHGRAGLAPYSRRWKRAKIRDGTLLSSARVCRGSWRGKSSWTRELPTKARRLRRIFPGARRLLRSSAVHRPSPDYIRSPDAWMRIGVIRVSLRRTIWASPVGGPGRSRRLGCSPRAVHPDCAPFGDASKLDYGEFDETTSQAFERQSVRIRRRRRSPFWSPSPWYAGRLQRIR
jgi:hypothetical protein